MFLSQERLKDYRKIMADDLLLFGEVITPDLAYDNWSVLHRDVARFHIEKPPLAAIVSPRGHGKTTLASTIATAHDIAYDREDVIVLIKKTFQQAVTDLQNIVSVIKYNRNFKAFYGEFRFLIDRQERVYILHLATGHKTWIEAKGATQSIRGIVVDGKRPTKILPDDFEDENNTATPEQREKVREWMAAQVMPSLDPHKGHILAIGTIVHYDSWLNNRWEAYQEAKRSGKSSSWKMIFHQMIEDGKPIWPKRFTLEYIDRLKVSYEELGALDKFFQEYMNIPFNPDNTDFSSGQITYYRGELLHDAQGGTYLAIQDKEIPVDVVMGIDPSTGLSADYTGIVVVATDAENDRYLVVAERKMMKPDELIELIFRYNDRYKPRKIIIEEVAMQVLLQYWLRAEMRRRGKFLPIRGDKVPTRLAKEEKLRNALQPIYASGVMHHLYGMSDLETELFNFPKGKHDDILDALYLAMKFAKRLSSKREVRKLAKKEIHHKRWDWMTGMEIINES